MLSVHAPPTARMPVFVHAYRLRLARPLLAALIGLLLLTALPVRAADPKLEAAQRGLAKAQQLLKQVAAQKQAIEAEKAKVDAELAALKKKLESTQTELATRTGDLEQAKAGGAALTGKLKSTEADLQRTEGQLADVVAKYRQLAGEHRDLTAAKQSTDADLAFTQQELGTCEGNNLALVEHNMALLGKYGDKSVLDVLKQREPFTGIGAVAVENVLQEYRFKLEDERYRRPTAAEADTRKAEMAAQAAAAAEQAEVEAAAPADGGGGEAP